MMTLRIIHNVWRYEKQNRNAQEIARRLERADWQRTFARREAGGRRARASEAVRSISL